MGQVPVRVILANACELVMTRLGVPPAVAEALGLVRLGRRETQMAIGLLCTGAGIHRGAWV
jgi:hypothetical protein